MSKLTLSTRSIRTFVLRQGRLTEGQQRSLDRYWPQFGIDVGTSAIDFNRCFGRSAPVWMEIGFGNGEALACMAEANPLVNFIGVEVHLPGVGHALGEIAARGLQNARVIRYDALELLQHNIAKNSLGRLSLFFPDPWHKTRHHKRRIVNAEFLQLLQKALVDDAVLHIATDWSSYATHIQSVLARHDGYEAVLHEPLRSTIVTARPDTKFEQRGRRLGHNVFDLVYRKKPDTGRQ